VVTLFLVANNTVFDYEPLYSDALDTLSKRQAEKAMAAAMLSCLLIPASMAALS
jgi:hypothetical protein